MGGRSRRKVGPGTALLVDGSSAGAGSLGSAVRGELPEQRDVPRGPEPPAAAEQRAGLRPAGGASTPALIAAEPPHRLPARSPTTPEEGLDLVIKLN